MLLVSSLISTLKQQFNEIIKIGKVKQIEITNRTYCFYNDIINTEEFDSNLLKTDKKLYKYIDIYYIGYITIKKLVIVKIFKIEWHIEPHACYKCHDVLMTAYELKNIAILNVKGVDFKCTLWRISRDEAVNNLNNSVLEDKGVS